MREQSDATGFPSIALPYGFGLPGDKPQTCEPRWLRRETSEVLARLALPPGALGEAMAMARWEGTDAGAELVAAGILTEETIADAIAAAFRLRRDPIDPARLLPVRQERATYRLRRIVGLDLQAGAVIAPRLEDLDRLSAILAAAPSLRSRLSVATPSELAEVRMKETEERRLEAARLSLSRDHLMLSARQTLTGAQGFAAGVAGLAMFKLFVADWQTGLFALHAAMLPVFFGCVALRFAAALHITRHGQPRPASGSPLPGPHPRYSILVALRNEGLDSVTQLVTALKALRWPRAKLQILLICEADDPATIAAVRQAIAGRNRFTLVEVPKAEPRTKPKALNFALPLATGELIALYDAEDRPHPDQLEAASAAFAAGGDRLACVQAPLVIRNGHAGWLPGHFAIEYRVLFSGLLPWLARHGLPLPLGGTSNHFRRAALLAVGAWDSHNVTEDADLGMRLARHGYRTGVIEPPTFEEAPEQWLHWLKQRTRWMKGWMQSWLVHMREPRRLVGELRLRDFAVFQALFAGMILSSLAHVAALPLLACSALMLLTTAEPLGMEAVLFGFDILAILAGYGAYGALAFATDPQRPRRIGLLRTLPFYWLAIGIATARAALQIGRNPHLWEKTPHGSAARSSPRASRRGIITTGWRSAKPPATA